MSNFNGDSLQVNFGDLYIPANLDYPQPHVIGSIVGQGISSGPIVVVDAQTILVPDFTFDGQAPGNMFPSNSHLEAQVDSSGDCHFFFAMDALLLFFARFVCPLKLSTQTIARPQKMICR